MQRLDTNKLPLQGTRLIEASAGTGKTHTIAELYLRLLRERGLGVDEILVVTFTEAATEELRDRVRSRIRDAAQKEPGEMAQCLSDALLRMDEAAIFTIHGFCQRVLSESAFESGSLFNTTLITDEGELRRQIVQDFWRRRFHTASAAEAQWVHSEWPTPDDLLAAVRPLLGRDALKVEPNLDRRTLRDLKDQFDGLVEDLHSAWEIQGGQVRDLLDSWPDLSRSEKNYRADCLQAAYADLDRYLDQPSPGLPLPAGLALLSQSRLSDAKSLIKGRQSPQHAFFALVQQLIEIAGRLSRGERAALLLEAADFIGQELEQRKRQAKVLYFDDLLRHLDRALDGSGGTALARRVRGRYRVALIDEFQDTDPVQYRIFHRIYGDCEKCGLFLIGDPKQAIYSFRGADIFTYMRARHDTPARYTLGTNWRSTHDLVSAVNRLFEGAADPFLFDEIPFQPVDPSGRPDKIPLTIDGESPPALTAWFLPRGEGGKELTKGTVQPQIAAGCAAEISRLLQLGAKGRARIGDRPLAAGDIAVLVRDRHEAEAVWTALNELGIVSIFISRDSVFATEEAYDLAVLLQAVAEPADSRLLLSALATRLLGRSAAEIDTLRGDELVWDGELRRLHEYHGLWQRQGFLAMFHTLLHREGVVGRLLVLADGERRLTNLMQLAELAQSAAEMHPGMENLLRWLDDALRHPDGENETQQLRLESDEHLVQIVTIHKSKGLQYPLVFLPFIWGSRAVKDQGILLYHEEPPDGLRADLGSERRDWALRLAERERLAEDLRLLYVAVTRAVYGCYFSWGRCYGAPQSAMAWLLHQARDDLRGQPYCTMAHLDDAAIRADLSRLDDGSGRLLALDELPQGRTAGTSVTRETTMPVARRFTGQVQSRWQMTSFSALAAAGHGGDAGERPDYDSTEQPESISPGLAAHSRYAFPRGARPGQCLHAILEELDFPAAEGALLDELVARKLTAFGFEAAWQPVVSQWIGEVLETPLSDAGELRLRRLDGARRLPEMAFHFPVKRLQPAALGRLLGELGVVPGERIQLGFPQISGMMKGFIDLVFEYQGRYYVADYKSNHLGDRAEAYTGDALRAAIAGHRYDLQYLIYTLALHRYLRRRIPDYDYERHMGGVYYLFLRGMRPAGETGIWFDRPAASLIDRLDRLMEGEDAG